MFALTITKPAQQFIQKAVNCASIARPAVYLTKAYDGTSLPQYIGRSLRPGEVKRLPAWEGREVVEQVKKNEASTLLACVFPRSHFLWLFMVEIDGVVFFMPPSLRKLAIGGVLDVGERGLVLRNKEGVVVLPKD